MTQQYGPQTKFSDELHAEKYRGPGESFREAMSRQAAALCDSDHHFEGYRQAILEMRYMAGGRIQSAVGTTKGVTPYNCFVSGTIDDSMLQGNASIVRRFAEAAATMRMGGGIGYDFSTLRPRGAEIKKLGSRSSGPVSFMEIFDALCRCVASSGHRRGAQMGVMRVDHPDIEEFVRSKQNENRLTGFNISVGVTDEFMRAVENGGSFDLKFEGRVHKTIDARSLWDTIMRSTWDWAEPGVLFIDQINQRNNLSYCETIAATNPCGEQPLPPHGACLLGSFNLTKYLLPDHTFAWGSFAEDVPRVVRAMDRVVDVATYPLYDQEKEAKNKRRMGLGVTGLANALEYLGHPYGSAGFLEMEDRILCNLRDEAYLASARLAAERGQFPMYRRDEYMARPFISTLPDIVRDEIAKHGMRNSHLLSIAPTGTISLCADNVSSGIEPVFAYVSERTVIGPDGPETYRIEDYGKAFLGVEGKVCAEVSAAEHLEVLSVAYRHVDSAVSKTCNVPSSMPWTDFKELYVEAWRRGCKGITTFREGGMRGGIMERVVEEQPKSCRVDATTGRKECD